MQVPQVPQVPLAPQAPERRGNPAVRIGLIFGLILDAVGVANALIQWATGGYNVSTTASGGTVSVAGASSLLGCLGFLIILALTFVAGMRAAGQTGKAGTGALAGLIAGLVGAIVGDIIGIIVVIIVVAPNLTLPSDTTLSQSDFQTVLIVGSIVAALFGLLIDAGIGAGLGALGGLVGANNYRKAQPATMYSGMPYAGYPPYGGAPGYPPAPGYGAPGYPSVPVYPNPQAPQNPYPPQQPPYGTPPIGPQ